jgi:hypothetical protein
MSALLWCRCLQKRESSQTITIFEPLTGGCASGLQHLGTRCPFRLIVLGHRLNSPYAIVESEADLRLGVVLIEVVVVEASVLECTDFLRDHLLSNS